MLSSWDFDDTTIWLRPVDLYVAAQLLARARSPGQQPSILEIGVWKGAWLLQLLATRPDVLGVGVDPYPGSPNMRQQVLALAAAKSVADRTTLVPTLADACATACAADSHRSFVLAHIDGLHVEFQVEEDLAFAARHGADDGIVIVDDYLHPAYPGVASAMYRFLADGRYAMLLTTGNKAYLCRAEAHAAWHADVERMLTESGLGWMRYKGEHTAMRYLQRPDVMGFEVILCMDPHNDDRVLAGLHRPAQYTLHQVTDRWIPTGCREALRPIRHRARRVLHPGGGSPRRHREVHRHSTP